METNPMVAQNVKVWRFIGLLWPTDNRKLFNLIPQIIMTTLMFNNLLFSDVDIENKTLNAFYATMEFNCTVSYYTCGYLIMGCPINQINSFVSCSSNFIERLSRSSC